MYSWRVYGAKAAKLLLDTLPYLLLKKNQAELAIEFQATKRHGYQSGDKLPYEASVYLQLQLLKRMNE